MKVLLQSYYWKEDRGNMVLVKPNEIHDFHEKEAQFLVLRDMGEYIQDEQTKRKRGKQKKSDNTRRASKSSGDSTRIKKQPTDRPKRNRRRRASAKPN